MKHFLNTSMGIIASIMFVATSVNAEEASKDFNKYPLRFTCHESYEIAMRAERILVRLTEIVQRQRELAIQAERGTLGSNDRKYLEIEYGMLNTQAMQLISHATFTDSYGEIYSFFKDGLEYQTLLISTIDEIGVPVTFKIEPFAMKTLGSLATVEYQVERRDETKSLPPDYLVIRGTAIPLPSGKDDAVSFGYNATSAIAYAGEINAKAEITGVYADVAVNKKQFDHIDMAEFEGKLSGYNFELNGIFVTGNPTTVVGLIDLINSYTAQTGVKARLTAGSNTSVDFYANDGRNIHIKVIDSLLPAFGGDLQSEDNIFFGKLVLRSARPFDLYAGFPVFGFEGKKSIELDDKSLLATSILTPSDAQVSLSRLDGALNEINLHRAQIGPMEKSCSAN